MKQYIALISILALSACGGGSGGGTEINLTPAEHLFGAGIGTGATPSHLIPKEDGNGFETLSFGAWGNIYDIKETTNDISTYATGVHLMVLPGSTVYDFTGQQNLQIKDWGYLKDESVSNATFTGPAIMYKGDAGPGWATNASDYGTVKIKFGYDIDNPPSVEFVMSNPENNLSVEQFNGTPRFSEDRNNVHIIHIVRDPDHSLNDKIYRGYGHKN